MKKRAERPTGRGAPRKPVVKVKSESYQPTEAELNEDIGVDTDRDLDDVARTVLRQVDVVEED